MKILVPVDGSAFTKRMLAYLAAHDEWLGAAHSYTVLHVAPAVPPRAAAVLDKAVLQAHYAEESDKVFKPIKA
ncbi:MAG: universal stress protein UspA, partial [Burkholderiales bacterium PBB5]